MAGHAAIGAVWADTRADEQSAGKTTTNRTTRRWTMNMTISELATCARDAQDGVALMRDADKQMKRAHDQWIEGALKTASALYAARQRLIDHAVFGKWCDDNGLGAAVISKDERAALIKIGADVGGWRETLAKTESRSLRLITAKRADPFSQRLRQAPPANVKPVAAQAAPKSAPVAAAAARRSAEPPLADEAAHRAWIEEENRRYYDFMKEHRLDPDEDAVPEWFGWWEELRDAGLNIIEKDGHLYEIVITDRDDAVEWFENALAAYDEAHPDAVATKPPGGA